MIARMMPGMMRSSVPTLMSRPETSAARNACPNRSNPSNIMPTDGVRPAMTPRMARLMPT